MTIRIALGEDQALVRHGLRSLLNRISDFDVVIDAEDGEALMRFVQVNRVDIIVTDIKMPKYSGIEITRWMRDHGDYTPVVLLTIFEDPSTLHLAARVGAQGFMLKDAEPEELETMIRRVAAGETLLAPLTTHAMQSNLPDLGSASARLTQREISILRLAAAGYSNKEIARVLTISDGTVKNHMSEIMRKLDARDRTHAVMKAISLGQM